MKKLLLIFLSIIMCLSVFVSCRDKDDTSSLSPESKNEESGQDSSESVSDISAKVAKDEIPKNVKYYNGDYDLEITDGIREPMPGITLGGESIVDEDAPNDLYYYVGFYDNLSDSDVSFLKDAGVIFAKAKDNFFVKGNAPYPIDEDMTEKEKLGAMRKNYQAMFENVDMSQYTDDEIAYLFNCFSVNAIGYVNISAHKAVANAEKYYSASLLPAENDKERYLKLIDSYRKQKNEDSNDVSASTTKPEMNDPKFDKAKVIYNPDEKHHEAPDIDRGIFEERSHIGLKEYISNTNDLEDAWFCVELNGRYTKNDTVFDIIPYLEKMGFVKDEALTLSFNPKGRDSTVVGYITTDMFEKLTEDNNPIHCAWLPKKCVDNGSHSSK